MKNTIFTLIYILFLLGSCEDLTSNLKIKGTTDLENGSKIFHFELGETKNSRTRLAI